MRRASIRLRWFLLASFFVVTVVGMSWPRLPYKVETTQICPVSGSISREIVWFGFHRDMNVEPTPLEGWIHEREPDFVPEFEEWCRFQTFLFSVRRTCSKSPLVGRLRSIQDRLVTELPEARLKELIRILRDGDQEKQREIVETLVAEFKS
jgi:hypothetical protein